MLYISAVFAVELEMCPSVRLSVTIQYYGFIVEILSLSDSLVHIYTFS